MKAAQAFLKSIYNQFSPPDYINTVENPDRVFSQESITTASYIWSFFDSKFPVLNQGGVCNGLAVDYARHIVSSQKSNQTPDYVAKLKRKFTLFGKSSQNFARRISTYQGKLQAQQNFDANTKAISFNDRGNFLSKLDTKLENSAILGLTFNIKNSSGHIIAIHQVKNTNEEIIGYKIFDPNFGEYDCSLKDKGQNKNKLNNTISALYQYYSKDKEINCSVVDLGNIVIQAGLVKGNDKYLENQVESEVNGLAKYRKPEDLINNLPKLLSDCSKNIEEITRTLAQASLEGSDIGKLKVPKNFLETILSAKNNLPEMGGEHSNRLTDNLMKLCEIKDSTRALAMLISGNKARKMPQLVTELLAKGADITSVAHKKVFEGYLSRTEDLGVPARFAIETENLKLLTDLKSFNSQILSRDYNDKSLLKEAIDTNKLEFAMKMIVEGFTLRQKELKQYCLGVVPTKLEILDALKLDKEQYINLAVASEMEKIQKGKNLKLTNDQVTEFKPLLEERARAEMKGQKTEEITSKINKKVANIEVSQTIVVTLGKAIGWSSQNIPEVTKPLGTVPGKAKAGQASKWSSWFRSGNTISSITSRSVSADRGKSSV